MIVDNNNSNNNNNNDKKKKNRTTNMNKLDNVLNGPTLLLSIRFSEMSNRRLGCGRIRPSLGADSRQTDPDHGTTCRRVCIYIYIYIYIHIDIYI